MAKEDQPYKRMVGELSRQERDVLEAITKPEQIISASVIETWHDDHELCFGVELNGVLFSFWWVGWDTIAPYKYWDCCTMARNDIINHLQEELKENPHEWRAGDEAWLELNDLFATKTRVVIKKLFESGTVHLIEKDTGKLLTNDIKNLSAQQFSPPWETKKP